MKNSETKKTEADKDMKIKELKAEIADSLLESKNHPNPGHVEWQRHPGGYEKARMWRNREGRRLRTRRKLRRQIQKLQSV